MYETLHRAGRNLTYETFIFWLILCLCVFVSILVFAAPYQTYRKDHCEWCGTKSERLVVHHIVPQHIDKTLANDHPENLITLCDPRIMRSKGCHWKLGHRGKAWKYDNQVMMKIIRDEIERETNNVSAAH